MHIQHPKVREAYRRAAAEGRIPTTEELFAEVPDLLNAREAVKAAQKKWRAERRLDPSHGTREWAARKAAKLREIFERPLRMGTMFSGIGAPEEACRQLGLKVAPVWYAEIEPAPSAVMAKNHPGVVNLGSVTAIDFVERAIAAGGGKPDIIVGGSPCQSFSLAGKRRGLGSENGNLALRFCNLMDALAPPLCLWENVKGAVSDATNVLGCMIPALAGTDDVILPPTGRSWPLAGVAVGPRRTVCWRVFDAKHWGTCQRRERIYMLAAERSSGIDPTTILHD